MKMDFPPQGPPLLISELQKNLQQGLSPEGLSIQECLWNELLWVNEYMRDSEKILQQNCLNFGFVVQVLIRLQCKLWTENVLLMGYLILAPSQSALYENKMLTFQILIDFILKWFYFI